jgi:hypothetical protein
VCAAASLGAARGWRLSGDRVRSLQAYRDFLVSWAHADPDVPMLREARSELDQLAASPARPQEFRTRR